tara:strand:+ start:218 stop:688 length:471 start_codon:yes stop_codon:yes gene_type:complete
MFNISSKLVKKLKRKKLKVSFAESCSGGMLANNITSISGASKVFNLGLITYSNQAKIKILKINKTLIQKYGAVSHECCKAMVINLSKLSNANINVSITGIAGPGGGTIKKPVGLVYIGIKIGNKIVINKYLFKLKNRILIQKATVKKAIKTLYSLI